MSGPPPLSINVKIAKTEVNTAQELREREKAAGRALQEEDTVTVQQNFSQSKEFIPENLVKTVSEGLASLDLKDGGTRSKKSVKVGPEDFEIRAVIGQGAYGRVLQVVQIKTKKIYAMKILQKGQVFKKKNVDYVKEERNILTKVDHPFVINLKCTFQTERKLYIVMEYAAGGELFNHLRNEGLFMEQTAAFYTAEIVLALEYLHYKGIIHRDLKPENVLLDETGHIRITDFGLAKVQEKDSTTAKTICGTDLYMAPEMLGGNGYGRAVDWWSLGTLLYEMLTGDPPFFARDTKKLYKKIMNEKPRFPRWLSSNCTSILKGLLTRNVEQRLGATRSTMFKVGGVQELKSHKFFKSIDWNKLFDKKVTPPHVPSITGGEADISNFDEKFTSQHVGGNLADFGGNSPKYKHHMDKAPDDAFAGFSFVRSSFLDALMGSKSPTTGDPESTFPTIYEAVNDENVVSTIDHPHAHKNLVANDKFEETATNDDDGESAHDEDHGCFHMDLDQ